MGAYDYSNNGSSMMSDNHTQGDSGRRDSDGGSYWNNYRGSSDSHNVQADQMNYKAPDGTHTFYNTQTGAQGVALGDTRQRDW